MCVCSVCYSACDAHEPHYAVICVLSASLSKVLVTLFTFHLNLDFLDSLEKLWNTKFHENYFSGRRVPCGERDGRIGRQTHRQTWQILTVFHSLLTGHKSCHLSPCVSNQALCRYRKEKSHKMPAVRSRCKICGRKEQMNEICLIAFRYWKIETGLNKENRGV